MQQVSNLQATVGIASAQKARLAMTDLELQSRAPTCPNSPIRVILSERNATVKRSPNPMKIRRGDSPENVNLE